MSARILVTGASGFVGAYLTRALEARHPDAIVTSLCARARPERERCVAVDLLDRTAVESLIREARPEAIFHLAAQSSVALGNARLDDATWPINVGGAVNLAAAIVRHAPDATVVVASSAEVYGGSFLASPVCETSALMPMNAYAKSKAAAERVFADMLAPETRLILARPFNHTGAGQREEFALPSFAGQVARIEAGRQPPRMLVGNLDVRRDFLDVRDVGDAYLALLDAAPTLPRRFVVNVASGRPWSLRELLERLRGMARMPFEIVVDPSRLRAVDLSVAFGEATLLQAMTGWTPKVSIDETLRGLLDAARARASEASEQPSEPRPPRIDSGTALLARKRATGGSA